jgi:sugar phosphate isomerase/epimerase
MTRRASLKASLALLASTMTATTFARQGFFAERGLPIGLQLYTLGDAPRTDLEGTLKRVAAIGYKTVELPGLRLGDAARVKAAADKAGLSIGSVHLQSQPRGEDMSLALEPSKLTAELRTLGATEVVLPVPLFPTVKPEPGEDLWQAVTRAFASSGADSWKRTAAFLNKHGEWLLREGIHLSYHNHNFEFAPVRTGVSGWDILVAETDPKLVSFEVDAGWVAAGGIDPVAFLKRHAGRVRLMHVKDILPSTKPNFRGSMDSTEVGGGTIAWKELLPVAHDAGVRHFYVEQEPPFLIDRFEAVARSYAFLTNRV